MSPNPHESSIEESDSSWIRVRVRRVRHHQKPSHDCQVGAKDIYQPMRTLYFGLYQTRVRIRVQLEDEPESTRSGLEFDSSPGLESPTSGRNYNLSYGEWSPWDLRRHNCRRHWTSVNSNNYQARASSAPRPIPILLCQNVMPSLRFKTSHSCGLYILTISITVLSLTSTVAVARR